MKTNIPQPSPDLQSAFRSIFLAHAPQRHAKMCPPTDERKYSDHAGALSDRQVRFHLAGQATYAVPYAHAGLAQILPLDVDGGGLPALLALLDQCKQRGLSAFAIYHPRPDWPEEQQRGYVFVPFSELVAADRLQALGAQLAASCAGAKVDSRATAADTRLPFGRHTHTGSYGELITLEGERIGLDSDLPGVLSHFFRGLCLNSPAQLPALPEPTARQVRQVRQGEGLDIAAFNRENDITELLDRYGARLAKGQGRRLYFCPAHDDKHASLAVWEHNGEHYCKCLSKHSGCKLAEHAHDPFGLYCAMEGLSSEEALRQLNRRDSAPQSVPDAPTTTQQGGCSILPPPQPTQPASKPERHVGWASGEDKALREYMQVRASAGAVLYHLARQKLGANATHRQVNAEIARRRGKPYDDRHLRRLAAERQAILEDYYAAKADSQGGAFCPVPNAYMESDSCTETCRGGQADSTRLDLPLVPPSPKAEGPAPLLILPAPADLPVPDPVLCAAPVASGAQQVLFGPAGAVAYPGGASFVPDVPAAASWYASVTELARLAAAESQSVTARLPEMAGASQLVLCPAEQLGTTQNPASVTQPGAHASAESQPALPEAGESVTDVTPRRYGPPSDPAKRRKYYSLLGKAKKSTSSRQKRWLEMQARLMEEPLPPAPSASEVPAPPPVPPRHRPRAGDKPASLAQAPAPPPPTCSFPPDRIEPGKPAHVLTIGNDLAESQRLADKLAELRRKYAAERAKSEGLTNEVN